MRPSQPISLDQFRNRKKKEEATKAIPGTMVWLFCSKCDLIEYTEQVAPYGRTHNCGTVVKEIEIPVDLRAEYTITKSNLEKIDAILKKSTESRIIKLFSKSLDKALIALRKSEETYLERLTIAANSEIAIYPIDNETILKELPVKEVNELGLFISEFRYKPETRFAIQSNDD